MGKRIHRNAISLVLALGCLAMGLLIVEQGRTIDSQRTLIHQLFRDSVELSVIKIQRIQAKNKH
jgi:hypothetical protein